MKSLKPQRSQRTAVLWTIAAAATTVAAATGVSAGCRYDPVPEDNIARLPEEQGEPSSTHRPGEPCLACHSNYEGSEPEMRIAGTIYTLDDASGAVGAAEGVLVTVSDSEGDSRKACTNAAGNFYVEREKWPDPVYPLLVQAGTRNMQSFIGREGSCAFCHTLPNEQSLDQVTGAGRGSAGVVLVPSSDLGQCIPSN